MVSVTNAGSDWPFIVNSWQRKVPVLQKEALSNATTKIDTAGLPLNSKQLGARADFAEYRDFATLKSTDLQPGDILLRVCEDSDFTHRLIIAGQRLEGAKLWRKRGGSYHVTHSAMTIGKDGEVATIRPTNEIPVSQSRGGNVMRVVNSDLHAGNYRVYRPRNSRLGVLAAQIAKRWGDGESISYNKLAAAQSVFRNEKFTKSADRRADEFAKDAIENNPRWGKKGAFCSQYTVAIYQAAAKILGKPLTGTLAVHADFVTPKNLDAKLKRDLEGFTRVGNLRITGKGEEYDSGIASLSRRVHAFQPYTEGFLQDRRFGAFYQDSYHELETGEATRQYDTLLKEVHGVDGDAKIDMLFHLAGELDGLEHAHAVNRFRDFLSYVADKRNGTKEQRVRLTRNLLNQRHIGRTGAHIGSSRDNKSWLGLRVQTFIDGGVSSSPNIKLRREHIAMLKKIRGQKRDRLQIS